MAERFAKDGQLSQAMSWCRSWQKKSLSNNQKARLLLTEGTLLNEHGQESLARTKFRNLVKHYPGQDQVVRESQLALGLSYLHEKQADSVRAGLAVLGRLFKTSRRTQTRRKILRAMIHGYKITGDTGAVRLHRQMLAQTGSPEQRLQTQLEWLEQDLAHLSYPQAMRRYDRLFRSYRTTTTRLAKPAQSTGTGTGQPSPSRAAGDTAAVASSSTSPVTQQPAREKVMNFELASLPGILQQKAAFLHFVILCKQTDLARTIREGTLLVKRYPKSPYSKWIKATITQLQKQQGGAK